MSLYGTGRAEGIGAVALIALLAVTVHWLGTVQILGVHTNVLDATSGAAVPSLAGMLCYRFLRAQGRSRYTAFLAGLAYAWSPWATSMAIAPREQLALALAPLALEAVCRVDRPSMRSVWLPWTGPCIAAPFLAGPAVIAFLTALLAGSALVRTVTCGDRDDQLPPWRGILLASMCGALGAGALAWLDPLATWLGPVAAIPPGEVLTAYRSGPLALDVAAILRVPGPMLVLFALLGFMRRQRHVNTNAWLAVAIAGTLPTLLACLPWSVKLWSDATAALPMLPAATWWFVLFATVVLGAAGLDDFLDLPMRRRTALAWLLALSVAVSPLVPTFGALEPALEWPLTGTFLFLALLMQTWRRLGILRWKNMFAIAAVIALATPLLQVLPTTQTTLPLAPPAPLGETLAGRVVHEFAARPFWHYSGLLAVALFSSCWAMSAFLRRRKARPAPTAPRAAIKKKVRPPHHS